MIEATPLEANHSAHRMPIVSFSLLAVWASSSVVLFNS